MTEVNNRPPFFPPSARSKQAAAIAQNAALEKMSKTDPSSMIADIDGGPSTINQDSKVDIPVSIKDFSQIKRAVDNSKPVDRSEKIADLKNQINKGEYQINDEAVANRMIDMEF